MACLVPAYSGARMILYEGFATSATPDRGHSFNDIFILDVATLTWTQGNVSTIGSGRGSHACAVS
ncbi:hypothetical protein BGZ80_004224, partial [Entomortierella chlamydospora]